MAIFAPWLMLAIMSRNADGVARHLQADVEAFLHPELLLHFRERSFVWDRPPRLRPSCAPAPAGKD